MKKNILAVVFFTLLLPFSLQAQSGFITVKGKEVIGADGKPFIMRGTNLGNWLVPVGFLFNFDKVISPRLINKAITELFGPDEAKKFWGKYMHSYITEGDIHYLKTIGVNSIRIPFNYRLFTNEDYLGSNDPNRGFELLDPVISWCKKEGIFVLLDMHAAPAVQT